MDLVVVAIPGVQHFIAESRSTADLYAASSMMSDLAGSMLTAVPDASRLVLPAPPSQSGGDETPNRVVVLADSGEGPELAAAMAANSRSTWNAWLASAFSGTGPDPPASPGFPADRKSVV